MSQIEQMTIRVLQDELRHLRRILAVERGVVEQAPEGWTCIVAHDLPVCPDAGVKPESACEREERGITPYLLWRHPADRDSEGYYHSWVQRNSPGPGWYTRSQTDLSITFDTALVGMEAVDMRRGRGKT